MRLAVEPAAYLARRAAALLEAEGCLLEVREGALVLRVTEGERHVGYYVCGARLALDAVVETAEGAYGKPLDLELTEPLVVLYGSPPELDLEEAGTDSLSRYGYNSVAELVGEAQRRLDELEARLPFAFPYAMYRIGGATIALRSSREFSSSKLGRRGVLAAFFRGDDIAVLVSTDDTLAYSSKELKYVRYKQWAALVDENCVAVSRGPVVRYGGLKRIALFTVN